MNATDSAEVWPKAPRELTAMKIAELLNVPVAKETPEKEDRAPTPPSPAEDLPAISGSWTRPEPLRDELPPVPAFDPELLPTSLRPWCLDTAWRMQVPTDFSAVTAVVGLSMATMRRAMIQPKRADTDWLEVPNLWGGIVAPPSELKTPTIAAMLRPLSKIEERWARQHERASAAYVQSQERESLEKQAWREETKRAFKKGEDPSEHPVTSLKAPSPRRIRTSDATFEAAHALMVENPAGIATERDELTGWWANLEKPGRESERAFYLEGWSGHGGFTLDRIGRGSVSVPHCCLSVFGGIQPGRLRSYLADALRDGPSNDGLIQRFQLLVWPDRLPVHAWVDRAPDASAAEHASRVYERLAEMDVENPLVLRFDDSAQEMFIVWYSKLMDRLRSDELSPILQAHLSKYRKLMPALALLFSLADGCVESVSLCHAQMAAGWCAYLEKHAQRVYASKERPDLIGARRIAKELSRGWKRPDGRFSLRDVYRSEWPGLTTPEEAAGALDVLCEYGWVREAEERLGRGRPRRDYEINPQIRSLKPRED